MKELTEFISFFLTWKFNISESIAIVGVLIGAMAYYITRSQYFESKHNQIILEKSINQKFYKNKDFNRATYCYVKPFCTSIDPCEEYEIRNIIPVKYDIFKQIDDLLEENSSEFNEYRHLMLLAGSGMGKTSFLLNYYAYNQKKRKNKRHTISIVPLGIHDPDRYINDIKLKENTVLFLDALDEDIKAINNNIGRIFELIKLCHEFKRVMITCRTQFFARTEEIPSKTGIIRVGPRKGGESHIEEFWKLYLAPLTDYQVKLYLKYRFRFNFIKRKKAFSIVKRIPLLSVRPMLLVNIPDLINNDIEIKYTCELYNFMISSWLKRERDWVREDILHHFSNELSLNIIAKRDDRGGEFITRNELLEFVNNFNIKQAEEAEQAGKSKKINRLESASKRNDFNQYKIILENWQVTGRSLLNHDAEGNWKFSHRSIMEYLFVSYFIEIEKEERPLVRWSDQMQEFALEIIIIFSTKKRYQLIDFRGLNIQKFICKNKANITSENYAFNFSNLDLSGSNFEGAYLDRTNFEGSDLTGANFRGAIISNSNLNKTNFQNANLEGALLHNSFLREAILVNSCWEVADLRNADLRGAIKTEERLVDFKRSQNADDDGEWELNYQGSFVK